MSVGRICRCGEIVNTGDRHACAFTAADNARRHDKQRAHGRDRQSWRTGLRLAILERDAWLCQLQFDSLCSIDAMTVHLRPDLDGDHEIATVDDGVAACLHCHGVADGPRASRQGGVGTTAIYSNRPAPGAPRILAGAAITKTGNGRAGR